MTKNPYDKLVSNDPHSAIEFVRSSEVSTRYKALLRKSSQEVLRRSQLEAQALENPVTGLPNRRAYDNMMLEAIRKAENGEQGDIAVAIIDLDKFKRVNDTLGHDKGDDLMRSYAARLQAAVRPGDTVVHFGGDEFAVLMPHLKQRPDHEPIPPEELPDRLTYRFRTEAEEAALDIGVPSHLGVSASVGISFYQPGDDPLSITKRADVAMYQNKVLNNSIEVTRPS